MGKDLLYFKKRDKTHLKGIQNLASCFISNIKEVENNYDINYCFDIIFISKIRTIYTRTREESKVWLERISRILNYRKIDDYYTIGDVLGEGSYGIVKLGVCKISGATVAVKIINKSKLPKLEFVKREIEIIKFCKHENIVAYIDDYEDLENIYIIVEYLQGGDLYSYLENTNNTENSIKCIIKQIAKGIAYLHEHGIIHRDLKPQNILLSNANIPKIVDFGLSVVMGAEEHSNDCLGTLQFTPPEIVAMRSYNNRVDVWSLGVILYYSIYKVLPFDDTDNNRLANDICEGKYYYPKQNGLSEEGQNLIMRSLEVRYNKRINIYEFLNHEWFMCN
jgi:serine/threonine protein kinase